MAAATGGDADVIEALLRAGADRGMRNDMKLTALDLAEQSGNPKLVELIKSHRNALWGLFGSAEK